MSWLRTFSLLLAGAALLPVSCAPSDTVTIQGAGATFPAPLYKRWFLEYYLAQPNVRVNYQAIGSGAGVSQLQEGLIDFAASDEALKKERLDEVAKALSEREGGHVELIQVPMTSGAIALCYNVLGDPQLRLTRHAYVGMALGEIKFWDDEAIRKVNPNASLPHEPITFIRRAESSGTTFVFTTHLNAIDDRWKLDKDRKAGSQYANTPDGPGASKTPQWRVGVGGKGNAGVAALIAQTPGGFGYIEAGYAKLVGLKTAMVENHAGSFVEPTSDNSNIALEEAKFDNVFGSTVPDPRGTSAYPIVTFTWVIARKRYFDQRIGEELRAVLESSLADEQNKGQGLSEELGYVKLPMETLTKARRTVQQIQAAPAQRQLR